MTTFRRKERLNGKEGREISLSSYYNGIPETR
jgi:hypothetical protein